MRLILNIILLCVLWLEIGHAVGAVSVRVMDSEFRQPLYWIERSTDAGRSWSPWKQTINGEWIDVDGPRVNALFRARL
jgi:hypothetical protein